MAETLSNPAQRLHMMLSSIRQAGNTSLRQCIASLFSIKEPTSPDVYFRYGDIVRLAVEVESRVRSVQDGNEQLFLSSIVPIRHLLSCAVLDNPVESVKNGLTERHMHGLEYVKILLDSTEKEAPIDDASLKRFTDELDAMIEEIRTSKLDAEFVRFLIAALMDVQLSIKNYRFFGTTGVRDAAGRAMGTIAIDPHLDRTSPQYDKQLGLVRRTLDKIKDINAVVNFVRNSAPVAIGVGNTIKELLISPS